MYIFDHDSVKQRVDKEKNIFEEEGAATLPDRPICLSICRKGGVYIFDHDSVKQRVDKEKNIFEEEGAATLPDRPICLSICRKGG